MFKKLKSFSHDEFLIVICGVLCILFVISIAFQVKEQQNEEVIVQEEPIYLEIHYGNGDVYTVETNSVSTGIRHVPVATLENGYVYRFTENIHMSPPSDVPSVSYLPPVP